MSAQREVNALRDKLERSGLTGISFDDVNYLRKCQRTLHRSATEGGAPNKVKARNRSRALSRIAEVCKRNGLHFYHQTEPRGCALYVAREPLTDQNYSSAGVACC